MLKKTHPQHIVAILYCIGFLFAFSLAINSYITSTFLSTFVTAEKVGAMYVYGSILSIIAIMSVGSSTLKRFGNYKVSIVLFTLNSMTFLILAFAKSAFFVIPAFILSFALSMILIINNDIFLEKYSSNKTTGGIRGTYLTIINIAWLISPMITGLILTNGDYWKIYLTSTILSLPIIPLLIIYLKDFEDPLYKKIPIWNTLKKMWQHKDIYRIFMINILLGFFYAWMVIYTPIYLHQNIGFSWGVIGIILTVMLLPFVLLPFPLGKLADKKWGEKEMLSIGFIVIAMSSMSISFISTTSFLVWALVLFMTRIGASTIETMSEIYFFKKINTQDSDIIEFFRAGRSIAYVVAPIIATVTLSFIDLKYIFIILGMIMLYGLRYSLILKDTK